MSQFMFLVKILIRWKITKNTIKNIIFFDTHHQIEIDVHIWEVGKKGDKSLPFFQIFCTKFSSHFIIIIACCILIYFIY